MTTELVKALRICSRRTGYKGCGPCPLFDDKDCMGNVTAAAADLIERLTAENAVLPNGEASAIESLRKEIEWKDMVIALAQREQAKAEAERDAAIVDLKIFAGCAVCKHCCNHRRDHQESLLLTCCDCTKKQNCKCGSCSLGRSNWEWRGLPETPGEGGKA